MRELQIAPEESSEPEIGRWLWALEEVRRRTLRLVKGLDQRSVDWEGPDGRENAIGTLLHHIGLVEMEWLFLDILQQNLPQAVKADFPHDAEDAEGRLTRILGVPLTEHLARLERSRAIFLDTFRGMSIEDWRRLRVSAANADSYATPEWVVFHLVEHEAGHAFQISALKARSGRFFASGRRLLQT